MIAKQIPSIFLLNPTSLAKPNAIQLLQAELKSNEVDIAMICETWFTPSHGDDALAIDGYVFSDKCFSERGWTQTHGRGACFLVLNKL